MPAADTATPAGGDLTVAYHITDLVDTITQGARTTDYTLDVNGERIRTWTDNRSGTPVTATHHYDGDDDNPAWTQETVTRYTRIIAGITGMAGIWNSDTATIDWNLANLHGDLAATINGSDPGISATHEATEYGQMRNPADTGTRRYGWLGAKQRAADTPAGISLMGVRLYNTTTGRFLQTDPVYGGSANDYDYCSADPINCSDLDGRWSLGKWWKKHHGTVLSGVSLAAGILAFTPCSAICAGIAAGAGIWNATYEIREHDYVGAGLDIFGAFSFGAGRYLKFARNAARSRYASQIGRQGTKRLRHRLGRKLGRWQHRYARHERWDKGLAGVSSAYTVHGFWSKYRHH